MDKATSWVMDIICGAIVVAIVIGGCLALLGQNDDGRTTNAAANQANNNVSNVSSR